jgi:hypothetical protein
MTSTELEQEFGLASNYLDELKKDATEGILHGEPRGGVIKAAKLKNMLNVTFDPTTAGAIKWTHVQESTDVFCVDFMLDVGLLSSGICSLYRRALFNFFYNQTFNFGEAPREMFDSGESSDMGTIYDAYTEEYERFMAKLKMSESLRIWAGTRADEACAMRWLCNELVVSGYAGDVCLMEAPVLGEGDSEECEVTSWGYVEPANFSEYISCERIFC